MSSSAPPPSEPPGDARPDICLSETRAPCPTTETAQQRPEWTSTGYPLPPIAEKPPDGPVDPNPKREAPVTPPLSSSLTYLYTLSYLVFFAIFGTLARLGLQAITFYPGAPVVTSVLWANVGGSLLMGFFLEDKNLFREEWGDPSKGGNNNHNNHTSNLEEATAESKRHKSVKKTIPLYIGLTTGFCGSFTSFSSFIRDVFLALANDLPNPSSSAGPDPRNGGYSFMALVAVILIEVSLSMGALMVGAHLALALDPITPSFPFRLTRRVLDPLFVFLGWGCWLGAVFMAIWPPDRHHETEVWRSRAVFAIVFAPLGCLLRFYLSLALNARLPAFPLGTFVVNIFGCIILAMCYDLQRVDGIGASLAPVVAHSILVSCQVLQGIIDGFCGTATTVSTWVAELHGLGRRRHAYVYGGVSVAVALAFFVIITGSLLWTLGFVDPVCM